MTYEPSREGREDPSGGFRVVRVPADVNCPDTLLAGLTARQLLILGAVAAALYGAWAATRTLVPPLVAVAVAVPVAGAAFAVVTVRRDGIGLDQLALAAARFWRSPRRLVPHPGRGVPAWAGAPAQPPVARLQLPATGIESTSASTSTSTSTSTDYGGSGGGVDGAGVVDLGSDGAAVVCAATTVNLGLRTPGEQDALVAGYGGWLNSLTGPVQIIIRADRIDLGPHHVASVAPAGGPGLRGRVRAHRLGVFYALAVALPAFLVFTTLHRLLARGGMIEERHLWPLAWAVAATPAALVLSPSLLPY